MLRGHSIRLRHRRKHRRHSQPQKCPRQDLPLLTERTLIERLESCIDRIKFCCGCRVVFTIERGFYPRFHGCQGEHTEKGWCRSILRGNRLAFESNLQLCMIRFALSSFDEARLLKLRNRC